MPTSIKIFLIGTCVAWVLVVSYKIDRLNKTIEQEVERRVTLEVCKMFPKRCAKITEM